jgi:hypothetical protein
VSMAGEGWADCLTERVQGGFEQGSTISRRWSSRKNRVSENRPGFQFLGCDWPTVAGCSRCPELPVSGCSRASRALNHPLRACFSGSSDASRALAHSPVLVIPTGYNRASTMFIVAMQLKVVSRYPTVTPRSRHKQANCVIFSKTSIFHATESLLADPSPQDPR